MQENTRNAIIAGASTGGIVMLLVIVLSGGIGYTQTAYDVPQGTNYVIGDYATFDFSLEDMAFDSKLVAQGKIVDQGPGDSPPPPESGMIRIPTTYHSFLIEKVMKGDPKLVGQTIRIVTDGSLDKNLKFTVEGGPDLKKGEHLKVFLKQSPLRNDVYAIAGVDQGKYKIDPEGKVNGKGVKDAPSDAFDAKIKDILSKPRPDKSDKNQKPGDRDMTPEESKAFEEQTKAELGVK